MPQSHSTRRPTVFIEVSGGVAYATATRGVRVETVDWDNLEYESDYTISDLYALKTRIATLPRTRARHNALRNLTRLIAKREHDA